MSDKSSTSAVVHGPLLSGFSLVFSPECLRFLGMLHRAFQPTRVKLLSLRNERQKQIDQGQLPGFLPETKWVREGSWKGPSIPADLADRRVEITGPVDAKMIINALNSDAKVFMADFEDSLAPTWANLVQGQLNLMQAVNRTLTYRDTSSGKTYQLKDTGHLATLMVRPRGWHLTEAHVTVDGDPMSASLFDFGVYFFHNAHSLIRRGTGPYFYLPKMESHLEARLWNDVFNFSQDYLQIPRGTIRATVLIETILAAFEMDEIIFELRNHSAGLNCGRWDYIFSFIKKFRNYKQFVLPDRARVTMTSTWMANYVRLMIFTCHKRGVHAMGGMAAQIPVKDNPELNKKAFDMVSNDKKREVLMGCDGTWVAHPGLIEVATKIFDQHMPNKNQIGRVDTTAAAIQAKDLLDVKPDDTITDGGIRGNLSVSLAYLEAWLRGNGCVPFNHLMEDAATAEISRCQVWQWMRHGRVDKARVSKLLDEEFALLAGQNQDPRRKWDLARKLLEPLLWSSDLADFLTLLAYPHILTTSSTPSGDIRPEICAADLRPEISDQQPIKSHNEEGTMESQKDDLHCLSLKAKQSHKDDFKTPSIP